MQVTILGTLPPIKGISEYCYEQTKALSKEIRVNFINFKKIYPKFLYPGGNPIEKNSKLSLKESENLKIHNTISWYNPFSWIKAGLQIKGSVFHFHWWTYFFFPIILTIVIIAKIKKKKIVCTAHNIVGHETNIIDRFSSKLVFKLSNKIIVHSEHNKKQLKEKYNIPINNIYVQIYGTLNFYKTKKISKTEAREKLNLKNSDKILLFFGTIRDYKGLDVLLKALAKVIKEFPDVKLLIAGKPWENWNKYERIITENKIQKNVIKHLKYIPTEEVQYYFQACDLVVLPYRHFESQSGPGLISLTFKKPLIVSNVGSLPDLINNKKFLFTPNKQKVLASKIINFFKVKPSKKNKNITINNNLQPFNWYRISQKTLKIYKM
jgi:glycosyltransferase involved in cell wall biosynthesis